VAEQAKKTYHWGTGRRKTAVARVRVAEGGSGKILINERALDIYFTEDKDRKAVVGPLELTELRNRVDVFVNVQGGGFTGQAGAISQGVARALKEMFAPAEAAAPAADDGEATASGMGKKLRLSGFLTRDGRMKERKKYGRKGARRSFQFSKR
jgi:small subunit ribosomal protein S9